MKLKSECAVCEKKILEEIFSLPKLPLTGRFSPNPMAKMPSGINQSLLYCVFCGHIQLAHQVPPQALYDDTYYFRTSTSVKAKAGTEFFLSSLTQILGERNFSCVLDVGCNDLYLLQRLKGRAKVCVGIDPIWEEKKISSRHSEEHRDEESHPEKILRFAQNDDTSITVIGGTVEEIDLKTVLPQAPELIVCRHTLEHIARAKQVLEKLFSAAKPGAVFCFEVPGFDVLLERFRFDQVFHEHLNYFSLAAFQRLIEEAGGEYLGHRENRHDWGALFIAFRKKKVPLRAKTKGRYALKEIQKRYAVFQNFMRTMTGTIKNLSGEVYGFGAAQMLPVLAYHLKTDFSRFKTILDDDPAKAGLFYWNLPLKIQSSGQVKLSDASIVLTALDNAQPILSKLLQNRPKNIVVPMVMI